MLCGLCLPSLLIAFLRFSSLSKQHIVQLWSSVLLALVSRRRKCHEDNDKQCCNDSVEIYHSPGSTAFIASLISLRSRAMSRGPDAMSTEFPMTIIVGNRMSWVAWIIIVSSFSSFLLRVGHTECQCQSRAYLETFPGSLVPITQPHRSSLVEILPA